MIPPHPAPDRDPTPSDVPDVLAPGLRVVFVGINPGRVSAAACAHFANPRNDFWRLLHAARLTSRLYQPQEQFALLEEGVGATNAAYRTTPGSGDLRRGDFAGSAERLFRIARDLRPRVLAFVGKEAYRGAFGVRPEHGRQERTLVDTGLFVLPSTSPANAAVPWEERLRWFRELRAWVELEPVERPAVRGLLVDGRGRTLLLRWVRPHGSAFWVAPGGGVEPGESDEEALRRELREEAGLAEPAIGRCLWTRDFVFPCRQRWLHQRERYHLVRVDADEVEVPAAVDGHVHEHRWWTAAEIEASDELFAPARLGSLLRRLDREGLPHEPFEAGV